MKAHRRARVALVLASVCGLAALAWTSFATPKVRLVYNPSNSVPVGWYRIEPARSLHVGSIVLTLLPAEMAALADRRGYLPAHVPLLKRVGAVAPQHVCTRDGIVRIDGMPVATVLPADRWGRPLPRSLHCRPLAEGEVFLLSTRHPASFDSRYYGPVLVANVIGEARPLQP